VLQIGEASKVAPVDKFSLVLVAVFAYAFLGERPSGREWLGITLVASGGPRPSVQTVGNMPALNHSFNSVVLKAREERLASQ
jgi:EamA-like transporter family